MYETCALRKQSTVRLTVGLSPTIILRREINKDVHGIANELIKHHPEGINNTTNSVTVVAVFFAAVAFAAIFTVRGGDSNDGKTVVVHKSSFKIFNFNGGPHCRASDAQPIHLRNLNGQQPAATVRVSQYFSYSTIICQTENQRLEILEMPTPIKTNDGAKTNILTGLLLLLRHLQNATFSAYQDEALHRLANGLLQQDEALHQRYFGISDTVFTHIEFKVRVCISGGALGGGRVVEDSLSVADGSGVPLTPII
ncbi:hypothetical protein Tco_0585417 [Tanacetum coccineum]